MPFFVVILFFKAAFEAVRIFRNKLREGKPEPLCVDCSHAHVQHGANARRAISCTYAGRFRPIKLDVLYCTDFRGRNLPARNREIGFVRAIAAAE
jgi:hypothetical protein